MFDLVVAFFRTMFQFDFGSRWEQRRERVANVVLFRCSTSWSSDGRHQTLSFKLIGVISYLNCNDFTLLSSRQHAQRSICEIYLIVINFAAGLSGSVVIRDLRNICRLANFIAELQTEGAFCRQMTHRNYVKDIFPPLRTVFKWTGFFFRCTAWLICLCT